MIKDFLFEVCDAPFISGFERMYPDILPRYFAPYTDSFESDKRGSYIFKSKGCNGKKIMLIAHIDELGLIVTKVMDNGFLKFGPIGFINAACLVAQEVTIFGEKEIYGIIGVNPRRRLLESEKKKPVTMDELYIDTGYETEELKRYVKTGDIAVIKRSPCQLAGTMISARGLDDKAGVAVMLSTAQALSKISHKSDVYYGAVVQEEGPGLGSEISAFMVEPDIGIVVDVGFGTTPGLSPDRALTIGHGAGVALGSRFNNALVRKFVETAEKYNFTIQYDVLPASSGTDAESVQISREGVPCILLSIPLRYMHTAVETLDLNDVESIGLAIAMFINEIDNSDLEELLCL